MMLALGFLSTREAQAADPPSGWVKRVAETEAASNEARGHYTYRQTVTIEELDDHGGRTGEYREVRDIIFSPTGERTEKFIGTPTSNLKRLILTDEDFQDIRQIQPVLFIPELVWNYEAKYRGEENVEGTDCWVLGVRPKQILDGQRFFDGMFWVDQRDCSVIRNEGQAVPQRFSSRPGKENLFPHFTTIRGKVGEHWFPLHTHADDVLPFRTGPIRLRMTIRYLNYKKFSTDSTITPR
ncbi:MAG TPA: hypothetical protein VE621_22320 [Bryobacteraceae bacterium]|nr:hypothetical protein [Bryobacteraceae bacterium]